MHCYTTCLSAMLLYFIFLFLPRWMKDAQNGSRVDSCGGNASRQVGISPSLVEQVCKPKTKRALGSWTFLHSTWSCRSNSGNISFSCPDGTLQQSPQCKVWSQERDMAYRISQFIQHFKFLERSGAIQNYFFGLVYLLRQVHWMNILLA